MRKRENDPMENSHTMTDLLLLAAKMHALKKAVFSKPDDPDEKRAVLTLRTVGGKECLQLESFRTDNKALHENLPVAPSDRLVELTDRHGQVNLFTSAGECELRRARSGKVTLIGGEKLHRALTAGTAEPVETGTTVKKAVF